MPSAKQIKAQKAFVKKYAKKVREKQSRKNPKHQREINCLSNKESLLEKSLNELAILSQKLMIILIANGTKKCRNF